MINVQAGDIQVLGAFPASRRAVDWYAGAQIFCVPFEAECDVAWRILGQVRTVYSAVLCFGGNFSFSDFVTWKRYKQALGRSENRISSFPGKNNLSVLASGSV